MNGAKSFDISKKLVWNAYLRVKANGGAPGVDGQTIEQFEKDLKNNLYRLWNRMSSGTSRRQCCVSRSRSAAAERGISASQRLPIASLRLP